ncbi:Chromodomain-helicase-DNA-binding protein [Dirofilaria immitis]
MHISIVLFVTVMVNLYISTVEMKLVKIGNLKVPHKLVKRHCSCVPSPCNCASLSITFQISCSCPQICSCGSYPRPLPSMPIPPITIPPTTPPTTKSPPGIPTYCCVLFICSICYR